MQNAASYLLSKQNHDDGGFGSSPSTVYETALTIEALLVSGADVTTEALNAVSYITANQQANGSWNDDPYSTALALKALANVRPNLTIAPSDLYFSTSIPQDNEEFTISANVRNTGIEDASNVKVRFFHGDPRTGGVQIGTDQEIFTLAKGASAQVSVPHTFIGIGGRTIFVQVDPDGLVSETTEGDNLASTRIWVATPPDLAVYSNDLKPSTYIPTPGTAFTLEYTVRNLGESAAGAFTIALYDGEPVEGNEPIATNSLSGLAGVGFRTNTIGVTLNSEGSHTLYLVADSAGIITEISEANNTASVTVQVGGEIEQADLMVEPYGITLTPARPQAGETIQVGATIRNQGSDTAFGFTLEIYDGAPEAGGTLLHSETLSLAAGVDQTFTTDWTVTAGIHDLYVIVDRENRIIEIDENNNSASIRVMPDMVDISVSANDLTFIPNHPVSGDSVVLSITAHNLGIRETGSFSIALYDGDPGQGGVLLQTWPISTLLGDGSETVTYSFTTEPRVYRFYAIADTENQVTELYENNNQAIRSLTIKGPGETYGPDLVPVSIDLSGMTTDSDTLAVSGTAYVTLQNKGDDKITTPFDVLLFEDMDNDGRYTQGVDTLLGTGTNNHDLWPEGANRVAIDVTGTVKFLNSPLTALIDSSDAVLEQDETNNLLRSGSTCEARPANPIEPVREWTWAGRGRPIRRPPVVTNLTDDNGDGKIDENDIPDLIFTSLVYYAGGKIWAVRGDTGETIFTIYDPSHMIEQTTFVSVGDIDNDGLPEILVPKGGCGCTAFTTGCGVLAYEHDGTLKWDNVNSVAAWNQIHDKDATITGCSVLATADMDADGSPEIISGPTVFNADGSVRWAFDQWGQRGQGHFYTWYGTTAVADIDLDGKLDIVAGSMAYDLDGTIKWPNTVIQDGLTAIGNFDDDAYPEIVLVTDTGNALVFLLEHTGAIKWGPVHIENFESSIYSAKGGPPTIADFDGDGEIEIGVKGVDYYFILDKNGNLKQKLYTPNIRWPGYSALTVFDLNGDNRPEVLLNDNGYFRIFDGTTGQELYQDPFGGAGGYQNVTIADVDGDGRVEALVTGYEDSSGTSGESLRVYGSKNNDWVNGRRVWNQPQYHVTNVNDDSTIPQYESPSWLLNNTYRTQAPVGENPNPYLAPNLTASYLHALQASDGVTMIVRIGNGGAKESTAGVPIKFYDGTPETGVLVGAGSTSKALQPGEYEDITITWSGAAAGLHDLYVVVDDGNIVPECGEDDNQVVKYFTVKGPGEPLGPDLVPVKIGLSGAATDPQTLSINGTASVTLQNAGDETIDTTFDVLLFEDRDSDGRYTDGVDTALGTGTNTLTLLPGGANLVSVPVSGSVSFLNAPVYAVVDASDVVLEQNESNNILRLGSDCEFRNSVGPITPVLKWKWNGGRITPDTPPVVVNITDDNGDGKIDDNDTPDVVFAYRGGYWTDAYALVALHGDTGEQIFSVSSPSHPFASPPYLASGDIDGDGLPEFILPRAYDKNQGVSSVLVYEHDGTLKWDNWREVQAFEAAIAPYKLREIRNFMPTVADIDADGQSEIIVGAVVINSDGTIRWLANARKRDHDLSGAGEFWGTASSIVADLDMDGKQEIVAGNTAYNHDGTINWWIQGNDSKGIKVTDGINAIGNFDDDPYPEVVLLTRHSWYSPHLRLYLLEHDGTIKWGPVYVRGEKPVEYMQTVGSAPVVADYDGDGEAEIGVVGYNEVYIYDKNGSVENIFIRPWVKRNGGRWSNSAASAFDLNGDNKPEILINDHDHFGILNGSDGSTIYKEQFGHGIQGQSVIMSDVDGDGRVEILVTGYDYYGNGDGIRAYDLQNDTWTSARGIRNQSSYHVTNVNDDGTIPQYESPSWLLNNTYRCQAPAAGGADAGSGAYLAPNLTASYLRAAQEGDAVNLTVRVGNGGAGSAPSGVRVTFYDGAPSTDNIIGTAVTAMTLDPGEYQEVTFSWFGAGIGEHTIHAVVNNDNTIGECSTTDNTIQLAFTIGGGLPDLKVGPEDITVSINAITEGTLVPIIVTVNNLGGVSAANVAIRMYSGDPSSGGVQMGPDQVIQTIAGQSTANATFTFDTLGRAGTNVLYFVADPTGIIEEENETNNSTLAAVTISGPALPDLAITSGDIALTPSPAQEGDAVSITATVQNRGAGVSSIPVRIYLGNPDAGGQLISEQTIHQILNLGETAQVSAVLDTTNKAGDQAIYVKIDPADTITENSTTNNSASKSVFIQSAALSSSITLDKAAYQASEDISITLSAIDTSGTPRSLALALSIKDSAGNTIATVAQSEAVSIEANGTKNIAKIWNTGPTFAGTYTVTAEFSQNNRILSRATQGFSITPDRTVAATVTVDKIQYNTGETVAITPVATSTSPNYIFENLTAKMVVRSQEAGDTGQTTENSAVVYTDTRTISSLMPEATFTFKTYWESNTSPSGTYTATLEILDGATVLATSTKTFELLGTAQTGAGLTGTITAEPSVLYQGEDETASYTVTNNGNEDLAGLTVTIAIVDTETGALEAEYGKQHTVNRGETITETVVMSTRSLIPGYKLAILRTKTADMIEPKTLASASFEVKPGIEANVTIPDVTNLLVWINDKCDDKGEREKGRDEEGEKEELLGNDGSNHEGHEGHEEIKENKNKKCIQSDLIEAVLRENVTDYSIVYDKKDFQNEMRNPYYTDFMILGDKHPLEGHFAEELREQVHGGKGLIASLFHRKKIDEELFGIKVKGKLKGADHLVELLPSDVSIEGTFQSVGNAYRIETENQDDVIGWINETRVGSAECGTQSDKDKKKRDCSEKYPAVIAKHYGQGTALYFAIDLGMSAENGTIFTGLVKNSIQYIHRPPDRGAIYPNTLVPIQIEVKSLSGTFDVRITETYPEAIKLFDPIGKLWIADNPWTTDVHLEPDETKTVLIYALAPDSAGTHTLLTGVGYLDNDAYVPYQEFSTGVVVEKGIAVITEDILAALDDLPKTGKESKHLDHARKYIEKVQKRAVSSESERKKNIHDILKAAKELLKATTIDTANVRLMMDGMLAYWEAEWYLQWE